MKLIDDVTGTPHWNQEFSLYDLFPIFLQPEAVFFLIKHVPLAVIRKPIPSLPEVGESSAWLGVVPMIP